MGTEFVAGCGAASAAETWMLLVTLVTPSIPRATASIFCLSFCVLTGPASVTTPLVTLTSTEADGRRSDVGRQFRFDPRLDGGVVRLTFDGLSRPAGGGGRNDRKQEERDHRQTRSTVHSTFLRSVGEQSISQLHHLARGPEILHSGNSTASTGCSSKPFRAAPGCQCV